MSQEEFVAFYRYKAFDVITSGVYKRHFTLCKDNGDAWAIAMHAKQNKVQQCIKQLSHKISGIAKTKLGMACRSVMNCAQPPVRIHLGFSQCFVTGVKSDKCLVISKSGKRNHEIHVHPKYAYFFLFFWFVCKLEYVIRACAKHWFDSHKQDCMFNVEKIDVSEYVKERQGVLDLFVGETSDMCDRLYEIFQKAHGYVYKSLVLYKVEFTEQPLLVPPSTFWDDATCECED